MARVKFDFNIPEQIKQRGGRGCVQEKRTMLHFECNMYQWHVVEGSNVT
jgi:hypothetical protein